MRSANELNLNRLCRLQESFFCYNKNSKSCRKNIIDSAGLVRRAGQVRRAGPVGPTESEDILLELSGTEFLIVGPGGPV